MYQKAINDGFSERFTGRQSRFRCAVARARSENAAPEHLAFTVASGDRARRISANLSVTSDDVTSFLQVVKLSLRSNPAVRTARARFSIWFVDRTWETLLYSHSSAFLT